MSSRIWASTTARRAACCLVAAAVAVAATGCGAADNPARRVACLTNAEGAAAMPLVARLYTEGRLGTPAAFKRKYFPTDPRSAYLDGSGHLKPWGTFTGQASFDLGNLLTDLETSTRYGHVIQAAYTRGRLRAKC